MTNPASDMSSQPPENYRAPGVGRRGFAPAWIFNQTSRVRGRMKRGPNKVRALILACCVAMAPQAGLSVFAQSSTGATTTGHKKSVRKRPTSIEKQMQEMRQEFQQQQEEIDQLKQQLQSRDQQLQQAQDTAQQAQQAAQQAQAQIQATQQSATQSTEAYTNLQQAVQGVQADQAQTKQ